MNSIRSKLFGLLRYPLAEFGPLIAFWVLAAAFGVKPAIAGSIATIVVDAAWRWRQGRVVTRLYLLVSALTLTFGAVDLYVATPFMLKYEAPITNVATGIAFVVGAFGDKPILQEVAEQRPNVSFPMTGEVRKFFRLLTLVWAAYFFLKAAAYVWVAATLPLMEALALRSAAGSLSLGLMTALSVTQGRRLFLLSRRRGWLGASSEAL